MRLVKCHFGQKPFQEISTDSVILLHAQTQNCHPKLIIKKQLMVSEVREFFPSEFIDFELHQPELLHLHQGQKQRAVPAQQGKIFSMILCTSQSLCVPCLSALS